MTQIKTITIEQAANVLEQSEIVETLDTSSTVVHKVIHEKVSKTLVMTPTLDQHILVTNA